jgi:hypothetical protein
MFRATLAALVLCSALVLAQELTADVVFTDGDVLKGCRIRDHHSDGFNIFEDETVAFSKTLDEAFSLDVIRSPRNLIYRRMQRIDVLPLTAEEKNALRKNFDLKVSLIKANVLFRDGTAMQQVYLIPRYLEYDCGNQKGQVSQDGIKAIVFGNQK